METNATSEVLTAPSTLIAFFDDKRSFEDAYKILTDLEYPPVSITLAMAEKQYHEHYKSETEHNEMPKRDAQGGTDAGLEGDDSVKTTKAAEGFAIGTTAGAGLGALGLLGVTLLVPGVAVIGALAATLAGAGAGGAVGGLTGLLFGSAHPEDDAKSYEENLANGRYMIRVSPKSVEDSNLIEKNWVSLGGEVEVR